MRFTTITPPRVALLVATILLAIFGQTISSDASASQQECDVESIVARLEADPSLMYTDLGISQDCAQRVYNAISTVTFSTSEEKMQVPQSLQNVASDCVRRTHTVTNSTLGLDNFSVSVQKSWCWNFSTAEVFSVSSPTYWTTPHHPAWSEDELRLVAHRWWNYPYSHQSWVQAKMRGEGFGGTVQYVQQDASMCAMDGGYYSTNNDCS